MVSQSKFSFSGGFVAIIKILRILAVDDSGQMRVLRCSIPLNSVKTLVPAGKKMTRGLYLPSTDVKMMVK